MQLLREFQLKKYSVKTISRSVNEWLAIALARANTRQYLIRRAIIARVKIFMTS